MFDLLRRNRAFRNLILGQLISYTGDWFNIIALVVLLGHSEQSTLYVAWAMVLKQIPVFLLTPVAGVIADRFDRRKIMLCTDLLRAGSVLGILASIGNEGAILGFVALTAAIAAFFEPARSASLPQIVSGEDLRVANSISGLTWQSGMLFGSVLGGICTELVGLTGAILIDSLSYLASACFIAKLPALPPRADGSSSNTAVRYREFLREKVGSVERKVALSIKTIFGFGGACYLIQLIMGRELQLGETGAGGVSAALLSRTAGAMLGSVACAALIKRKDELFTIISGFLICALGYLLVGIYPLWFLLGVSVGHFGSSFIWIGSNYLVQRLFENEARGRAFGLDFGLHMLASSISVLAIGALVEYRWITLGSGSILCAAIWLAFSVLIARVYLGMKRARAD